MGLRFYDIKSWVRDTGYKIVNASYECLSRYCRYCLTDSVVEDVGSVDNIGGLDLLIDDDRALHLVAFGRGPMKEGGQDEEVVSSPSPKVCTECG